MTMYSIITWRDDGPLKSVEQLRDVQRHNLREEEQPHCDRNAPAPMVLVGTGDLVADVRARLANHGLNLSKIRKNGVIAYEAVITASREFFEQGAQAERAERVRTWASAVVEFVHERFGAHRVVHLVLHLDELTPHMHLVVVPLALRIDRRRREREPRWSLAGRMISGPGKYDQLQTDFARAMARFGLERGQVGSGRKYRPVREYLEGLEKEKREAEEAKAKAEAERAELAAYRAESEAFRQSLIADFRSLTEYAEGLEKRRLQLLADRNELRARKAEFDELRDALAACPEHLMPAPVRAIYRRLLGLSAAIPAVVSPLAPAPSLHVLAAMRERGQLGR